MLPAPYRLRRNEDIRRVRQNGRRWHHALAVLHVQASEQEQTVTRFAFVASRRIGKAVQRNRAKRLLREAIRYHLPHIVAGCDCLIVAKSPLTAQATYEELVTVVHQLLQRARLLQSPSPA